MKTRRESCPRGIVQQRFASVTQTGMVVDIAIVLITFGLYLWGRPAPLVPLVRVPELWEMSANEYGRAIAAEFFPDRQLPTGWAWLHLLGYSDYLTYCAVSILASTALIAYAAILPILARQQRWIYFVLGLVQLLVLGLAASGIVLPCR
ncbi:MAG: hypothetical protein ACUVWX_03470 [Kiritimatiellia bacterium]